MLGCHCHRRDAGQHAGVGLQADGGVEAAGADRLSAERAGDFR